MTDISPQISSKFSCIICDYKCSKQSDYSKHLLTAKHQSSYISLQNNDTLSPKVAKTYNCDCGKEYKYRQGLYAHRKLCNITVINNEDNEVNNNLPVLTTELFVKLLKQNEDLQNMILNIVKEGNSNNTNNTNNSNNTINNINCNNKSFNLNVFLNEQCKDAMNMSEFVDTIKMQLSDLENFAHLGYADGVSKIFVQGINALEIHLRPIHCSDSKRETLYIKDNNEWVKETDDKPLIKSAIKRVAFKNIKQINEWVKENPECKDPRTKKYDKYNKIVMNSMSGGTIEEQHDNIEKIVKNVTKAVAIDKYALR